MVMTIEHQLTVVIFAGHTQELTRIARLTLGGAYQFRRSY
jgi:hypothetical protein